MRKSLINKKDIIAVANDLAKKGINPTVLGVKAILGEGSPNTINKYLRYWKQEKLAGKTELTPNLDEFKEKLQSVEANLQKQQALNQELLQELYKEQQATTKLEVEAQNLLQEKIALNLKLEDLEQNYMVLEAKYTEVTTEREVAIKVMLNHYQEQINLLQEELFTAHKSLKDEVLKLAYQNQENVLAEKLKIIKQEDLISQLKDKIKQLQEQNLNLATEKRLLQSKLETK